MSDFKGVRRQAAQPDGQVEGPIQVSSGEGPSTALQTVGVTIAGIALGSTAYLAVYDLAAHVGLVIVGVALTCAAYAYSRWVRNV